jgi:hypothetical protein
MANTAPGFNLNLFSLLLGTQHEGYESFCYKLLRQEPIILQIEKYFRDI